MAAELDFLGDYISLLLKLFSMNKNFESSCPSVQRIKPLKGNKISMFSES